MNGESAGPVARALLSVSRIGPIWSGRRGERAAVRGLVVAMALAAATILWLGRDLTFWSDEFAWLTFGDDFAAETLLTPHNGHLIAVPRLVYELLPRVFGPDYLPFRLLALASFLSCVGLFFLLARREVGGLIALAPSVVLLFFGSSAVIVLSPLSIPITLSIAFGLGALLALDGQHRHDLLAATLLALSLLSDSFGVMVVFGVVLYFLIGDTRRRLWVPLAPLAMYGGWWIWAQRFDQGIASASNLSEVPAFVVESAVATLTAMTGFAGPTFDGRFGSLASGLEVVFVIAAAAALLFLGLRLRGRPAGPWLWSYLLIVLVFWVALGFSEGPTREPTTPRYLFFGSIMVLLVAAARTRGAQATRAAVLVLLAFCSASLVLNATQLVRAADSSRIAAVEVRAQLGVLELAGSAANPAFLTRNAGPPASRDVAVATGPYLDFVEATGNLGFSAAELSGRQQSVRAGADFVLARAEGLLAVPDQPSPPAATKCERKSAPPGVAARFGLAEGTTLLRLAEPGPPQPLLIGRFGPPTVPIGALDAESFAAVVVPPDGASEPWAGQVAVPIQVCRSPAAG